jgi:hypothetical protein
LPVINSTSFPKNPKAIFFSFENNGPQRQKTAGDPLPFRSGGMRRTGFD